MLLHCAVVVFECEKIVAKHAQAYYFYLNNNCRLITVREILVNYFDVQNYGLTFRKHCHVKTVKLVHLTIN